MSFVVIGFGTTPKFPRGIIDKRVNHFDVDMEHHWLALLWHTDCVIGVHGSNMILPTGLAECAVELLPEDRYGNILQDYLLKEGLNDPYKNLFRFRVLYGNKHLTDISPYRVAQVVVNQLTNWERFQAILDVPMRLEGCGHLEGNQPHSAEVLFRYRSLEQPDLSTTRWGAKCRNMLKSFAKAAKERFYGYVRGDED